MPKALNTLNTTGTVGSHALFGSDKTSVKRRAAKNRAKIYARARKLGRCWHVSACISKIPRNGAIWCTALQCHYGSAMELAQPPRVGRIAQQGLAIVQKHAWCGVLAY